MAEILTADQIVERSEEIDVVKFNKEVREVVAELKKIVRKEDMDSLAAPAIGHYDRIFVMNYRDLEVKTYINPVIAYSEGLTLSRETSPVCPGKTYLVPRCGKIRIAYQTPTGQPQSRELLGYAAFVFQKEIQLLDGISLADIGLEIDEMFDNAPEEEQNEVIEAYLDALDIRAKELNKEIEEDEALKQTHDAIKFMQGVAAGEVKQQ